VSVRAAVTWLAVLTALGGCGLKGPLYLPEKSQEVVIRPAPGESASGTPGEPAAPPEGAPEPPPEATTPPPAPDASQTRPPGSGRG